MSRRLKRLVVLARTRPQPTPIPDGIHDLPAGKIAAVATYLEMARPAAARRPVPMPGRLEPIGGDVPRYRRLYGAIGEPWLWFSRAVISDKQLAAIIGDDEVETLALVVDGRDVALVELDRRRDGEIELAFFGLVPGRTGRGLGRVLMAETIRRAFLHPVERLWLHTCTLDHPAAMPFYLKAGFKPYRRAIEIADDPRLAGHLPRGAAPAFPTL